MGKSLAEYAAAHRGAPPPPPEPFMTDEERQAIEEQRQLQQKRIQEEAEAAQLKTEIRQQLKDGQSPQAILYTAITCIGLYTHDPEFTEEAHAAIDRIYGDVQQGMFDRVKSAEEKLEAVKQGYYKKLEGSITRQLAGNKRMEQALNDVLNVLKAAAAEDTAEQ